jgi:hypothetical protein
VWPDDRPGILQDFSRFGSYTEYAKPSFDVGNLSNRLGHLASVSPIDGHA